MPHNLSITDKILAKTLLPIIPRWVTPNYVSWMRLCSVPFVGYFLLTQNYAVALPLFFVSAFSDAIDGSLARTRDQVTHFGKMFDPLADKLLIATAAIILIPHFLGWTLVVAMVSIDIILITSAFFRKQFYGTIIQAENTGKLKMVMQSIGIGALLIYTLSSMPLFLAVAMYSFYAAIFFALVSLVVYRAV
jgi:CDP-diacylglycerol--glycerol-3-phosphate 3-phosphatidyltransferase